MAEHLANPTRPIRPRGHGELRRVVAANIRSERLRYGWSLETVADRLTVYLGRMGSSTISSWENTRNSGAKGFTVEELYALCKVFRLSFAELLAAPSLLDMPPITILPGEDSFEDLASLFSESDSEMQQTTWRRYASGITEEEEFKMDAEAEMAEARMIEDGERPFRQENR